MSFEWEAKALELYDSNKSFCVNLRNICKATGMRPSTGTVYISAIKCGLSVSEYITTHRAEIPLLHDSHGLKYIDPFKVSDILEARSEDSEAIQQRTELLDEFLGTLNAREIDFLFDRYACNKTFKQIGDKVGLHKQQVKNTITESLSLLNLRAKARRGQTPQ